MMRIIFVVVPLFLIASASLTWAQDTKIAQSQSPALTKSMTANPLASVRALLQRPVVRSADHKIYMEKASLAQRAFGTAFQGPVGAIASGKFVYIPVAYSSASQK